MFMKMRKEKKKKKKGYWQSFDYKVTGNLSFKFKLKSTVVELELVCLAFKQKVLLKKSCIAKFRVG